MHSPPPVYHLHPHLRHDPLHSQFPSPRYIPITSSGSTTSGKNLEFYLYIWRQVFSHAFTPHEP